jgi:hypothetical protein
MSKWLSYELPRLVWSYCSSSLRTRRIFLHLRRIFLHLLYYFLLYLITCSYIVTRELWISHSYCYAGNYIIFPIVCFIILGRSKYFRSVVHIKWFEDILILRDLNAFYTRSAYDKADFLTLTTNIPSSIISF